MAKEFDLVVRGGTIADGTGAALHEADIAVKDGKIAAVGKAPAAPPRRSTPRACWSRRASSTSTRTMTARRPGIALQPS